MTKVPGRDFDDLFRWRVAWVIFASATLVAAALPSSISEAGASVSTHDERSAIVAAAQSQIGYADSPHGTYCNLFSAYWGSGSACGNGNRSVEWCADFAAWAWAQAGVTGLWGHGINSLASRFLTWGAGNRNWHLLNNGYSPQPGDVAEYNDQHVGIYVGGPAASPTVVNGDWWYPDTGNGQVFQQVTKTNGTAAGYLTGYVSPPTGSTTPPPPPPPPATGVDLAQNGGFEEGWGPWRPGVMR